MQHLLKLRQLQVAVVAILILIITATATKVLTYPLTVTTLTVPYKKEPAHRNILFPSHLPHPLPPEAYHDTSPYST
jgi:hypothetical protein